MTEWPKGAIRNQKELDEAGDIVFGTYPSFGEIRKIKSSLLKTPSFHTWFKSEDCFKLFNNYWDAHAFLQRYLHAKRTS